MAITQDRMIRVIDCATILINNNEALGRRAVPWEKDLDVRQAVMAKDINLLAAYYNGLVERIHELSTPLNVAVAIATERTHFNSRKKANVRASDRMRALRVRNNRVIEEEQEDQNLFTPNTDLNLDINLVHQKVFEVYKSLYGEPITTEQVEEVMERMGQKGVEFQGPLMFRMIEEGRMIQAGNYGGKYTITAPDSDSVAPPHPTSTDRTHKPEALLPAFRSSVSDSGK